MAELTTTSKCWKHSIFKFLGYRTGSGRAYLNYCLSEAGKPLYQADLESAYRDAIIVELMGYDNFDDAIKRHPHPKLLLDYIIIKEAKAGRTISEEDALTKVIDKTYSLKTLFPKETLQKKATAMLSMMNDAHGLDLTRCYSLYPTRKGGSNSIGIIDYHLSQSQFLKNINKPNAAAQLESFYQFLRTSFDTLELTGQNSMFGLLSRSEFAAKKTDILEEVKNINDFFKNSANKKELLSKAKAAHKADDSISYFKARSIINETFLLEDYQSYLIVRAVSEQLAGIVEYNLGRSQLLQFTDAPSLENLEEFHRLMSLSYNTLPGKSILNAADFAKQKSAILEEIKETAAKFIDPRQTSTLINNAKQALEDKDKHFSSRAKNDKELLKDYRNFSIASLVYQGLTGKPLTESLQTRLYSDNSMFHFQHKLDTSLIKFDHHKNALALIHGLQKVPPYKGVEQAELPKISTVRHQQEQEKTSLGFSDLLEASHFQDAYTGLFAIKAEIISKEGQFFIEVDRAHYQQMKEEQLIEFKQASVPKKVEGEETLIDEQGSIDALSLIEHHQGLVRLVSTTALNGEAFPDYKYFLNALEDPAHQRYTPALKDMPNFPIKEGRYYDPRSDKTYNRQVQKGPVPELRFQEPITQPRSFAEQQTKGWTKRAERGAPKNTIYTKKLAHTLMPAHGKVMPFAGYTQTQHLYFPIGVLSDVKQVDLKEERYIWASNMVTASKFWLRDPSTFRKSIYTLLNAQLNNDYLARYANGSPQLDHKIPRQFKDMDNLISYLSNKATKFGSKMDEKYFRPTDQDLKDFKILITQQRQAYLRDVKDHPRAKELTKIINDVFNTMNERVKLEGQRKGLKYSMTLRELIKHQEQNDTAGAHNEILAANTKGATRAFYATKDTLLDRLNVALHATKIKEQYGYDVPLLVMSQDKAPYHYTEAMIRRDLQEAANLLRTGSFPFDRSTFKVYEYDASGKPIIEAGERVVKRDEHGRDVEISKDITMQKSLLLEFFKLGLPELTELNQLTESSSASETLSEQKVAAAIAQIIEKMDILGGLKRETALMERTIAKGNSKEIEQFFLRSCSLGHASLVQQMLLQNEFTIPSTTLEAASKYAQKNKHPAVTDLINAALNKKNEDEAHLLKTLKELQTPLNILEPETYQEHLKQLLEVKKSIEQLNAYSDELKQEMDKTTVHLLLNKASLSAENTESAVKLLPLLETNIPYQQAYFHLLKSGKLFQCESLVAEQTQYGINAVQMMELLTNNDQPSISYYKMLLDSKHGDLAEQFKVFADSHSGPAFDLLQQDLKRTIDYC